jgi:hypothetical protein
LQEVRLRLDTAETEEQYQVVGLLCREVLISVAQEVYDPARHPSIYGVAPSSSDAKRMLESVFESDLKGSESKEAALMHARRLVFHLLSNTSAPLISEWRHFVRRARYPSSTCWQF